MSSSSNPLFINTDSPPHSPHRLSPHQPTSHTQLHLPEPISLQEAHQGNHSIDHHEPPLDHAQEPDDPYASLLEQALNVDGTPKRPMNAFMIFAKKRRSEISAANPLMRTGEVSKVLSHEWNSMPQDEKQFYTDQSKKLKDNFNSRFPNYVYRRRPNHSRRKRLGAASSVRGVESSAGSPQSPDQPLSPPHDNLPQDYERYHPSESQTSPFPPIQSLPEYSNQQHQSHRPSHHLALNTSSNVVRPFMNSPPSMSPQSNMSAASWAGPLSSVSDGGAYFRENTERSPSGTWPPPLSSSSHLPPSSHGLGPPPVHGRHRSHSLNTHLPPKMEPWTPTMPQTSLEYSTSVSPEPSMHSAPHPQWRESEYSAPTYLQSHQISYHSGSSAYKASPLSHTRHSPVSLQPPMNAGSPSDDYRPQTQYSAEYFAHMSGVPVLHSSEKRSETSTHPHDQPVHGNFPWGVSESPPH
ncbi:hypothetical protein SISSUDRAFT_1058628 [Sistotremastrum suecicum HHB10207 ss-3]|uniref:HMG box domain-containing protein n=1 Tax=Sistotremastrum suecicum HHB10207 ss-3 TaxID=1314776 RepID=A0A166HC01_9AGAM|nr:hypothetical protein SISSUDRAFT_1058628 [Sistotremastrum suecicum HHB10207 ss-3]